MQKIGKQKEIKVTGGEENIAIQACLENSAEEQK